MGAWERILLLRFYRLLDRAGLPIPRGHDLLALGQKYFDAGTPWPDPVFTDLLALAQHNGVPTRLLDWTSSRKIAAYFAAVDALKERSESFDIWALSSGFVDIFGDKGADRTCHIVRTLRHGNPNLHAQAGVFTLSQGRIRGDDGKFITLDRLLGEIARQVRPSDDMLPCIRRFQLPTSEAGILLEELRLDQIDALTLFPGYAGVVRALREQELSGRGLTPK